MTRRKPEPQEPVVVKSPKSASDALTVVSHPAFGVATLTRWSSNGPKRLFGSSLAHYSGVTLRVSSAEEHRTLSRDRVYGKRILLEIDFNEWQFSKLVAGTIQVRSDTEGLADMPGIAEPEVSKLEEFGSEMEAELKNRLRDLRAAAKDLKAMIDKPGTINRKELSTFQVALERLVEQAPGNAKFIYDSFTEATERAASEARASIEAHVRSVAHQVGLGNRDIPEGSLKNLRLPKD
jgi:hypothetical protein